MKYYISQSHANPFTRIVAALVASVCLLGAFFFGLVILAVIVGLMAVFSLLFWLRAWWLKKHATAAPLQRESRPESGQVLEGEYTVVSERRD